MDIITDEYSRQVGRRAIAKHNARVKHMSYQFTPETLAGFTVKLDDIFNIAPAKSNADYITRITAQRAEAEQNKQAKEFAKSQINVDIEVIKEQLKDPNVDGAGADELYEALKKLEYSKIDPNDPLLVKKQESINKQIANMKRERQQVMLNYGIGLRDVVSGLNTSNLMQQEAIRKYGSMERALHAMNEDLRRVVEATLGAQRPLGAGGAEIDADEIHEDHPPPEIFHGDVLYMPPYGDAPELYHGAGLGEAEVRNLAGAGRGRASEGAITRSRARGRRGEGEAKAEAGMPTTKAGLLHAMVLTIDSDPDSFDRLSQADQSALLRAFAGQSTTKAELQRLYRDLNRQ